MLIPSRTNFARGLVLMSSLLLAQAVHANGSGTIDATSTPAVTLLDSYDSPAQNVSNASPVPQVDSGPRCNANSNPCDNYQLTIKLPAGYAAAHGAAAKVTMSWKDAGSGSSDYDLYVYKGTATTENGTKAADFSSASGNPVESTTLYPLADGTTQWSIFMVPYTASGEKLHLKIELVDTVTGGGSSSGGTSSGGSSGGGAAFNNGCGVATSFGGADPAVPGCPRYQILKGQAGQGEESSGEFNIGYNPATGRMMTMNAGPIWRVTPPEKLSPAKPEVCDSLWEDKSSTVTDAGLDPILWTDQKSGRTFASNSTVGANADYAYTDNDGDLWTPIGAAPPNGGADHQTIGTGPYPAGSPAINATVNKGQVTYYCSQDIVGPATCQRSDTLGSTFGNGAPAYDGTTTTCGGLHGHLRVAPNGYVYLPVNQCNGKQGGAKTPGFVAPPGVPDTWSEFIVQGTNPAALGGNAFVATSQANGADPSVATDATSRVYYCYVNNEKNGTEGHVHIAVSEDNGAHWIRDVDVGKAHGIVNAAQTEAWGGSDGRAACGFIGTNVPGNYQAASFTGVWYLFIAHTYDGGKTWVTTNATPNDPVQGAGGVWQQGGSGAGNNNRNLLDFDETTADEKGRMLFGFSDGCVTTDCISKQGAGTNDFVANMRVARQLGGKSLFSSYDSMIDTTVAKTAGKSCLLPSTRDATNGSKLSWKAPDNGGSEIVKYEIYRGTASGMVSKIGETADAKPLFTDASPEAKSGTNANLYYRVKAVTSSGTLVGLDSNEILLTLGSPPPVENLCAVPGLTELTDKSGDNTPATPGTDLKSFTLSQPYAADGTVKLTFTINTDAASTPPAQGMSWYVAMKIANSDGMTFRYAGVQMVGGGTAPTFQTYVPAAGNGGTVDGRFVTAGSTKAADATSSYTGSAGKIVIVAKLSDLGLNPGDQIAGFVSGVSASAAGVATALVDQMPDSLAYTTSYTVPSNQFCRPNAAPVANLVVASPSTRNSSGNVTGTSPYTVTFTGTGTDPDTAAPADTIASFTMDFGDGSAPVTQNNGSFSHQYSTSADRSAYQATLTVTDSRGKASTNSAFQVVEVLKPVAQEAKPFSFIERVNVPVSSFVTSEEVTLSGFTGQLDISVSSNASMQYSLNGGPFTNTAGKVNPGDKLRVRHLSSSAQSAQTTTSVKVGTATVPFKSTTTAADRVPDAFGFGTVTGLDPGVVVESADITLTGYTADAPIVAGPGIEYSLDSGAHYTRANGNLAVGQKIRVRETTNTAHLGYTKNYIKVGGVTGYFTVRTK